MARFENKVFSDKKEHVDGNSYNGCTFIKVEIVYSGGEPPSFTKCSFDGVKFAFEGAAGRTTAFIQALSRPESGFREIVKQTFPSLFNH